MATDGNSRVRVATAFVTFLVVFSVTARADFQFGIPRNLGPTVNSAGSDGSPEISADGQTLYFDSIRADGIGDWDIWMTTRTPEGDWGAPELLPWQINSYYADAAASLSTDGLSLYFASDRFGGYGSFDLWVTTRKSKTSPWGTPTNLGPTVNTYLYENHPCISADGLSLYFDSSRAGGQGYDIWVTTRTTTKSAWKTPINLGPLVNSGGIELSPDIHAGDRILFFDSRITDRDIWMVVREWRGGPWGPRVNVGSPLNTSNFDCDPSISADGTMLYFSSDRSGGLGGTDLWEVPILVLVDLNDDGLVDLKDYSLLARHWGQSDRSADIGPIPLGDGLVDAWDLAVLAESWLADSRLVAHWTLDEASGTLACDSVGGNDGLLQGNPLWLPQGGRIGGALRLDGFNDYIMTERATDTASAPFSIFAWVQGGLPGQVILSQAGVANWLDAGAPDGVLSTELKQIGRNGRDLACTIPIADGAWHQVGLTWDGFNRILYIDGVEVAADTQASLHRAASSLYIGTGSRLTPGTFWSGLIDDVRIYKWAVIP